MMAESIFLCYHSALFFSRVSVKYHFYIVIGWPVLSFGCYSFFSNHCLKCLGLPISDLTVLQSSDPKEIVSHCFHAGFSYKEILLFLLVYYGIEITLRQLHRILRKFGLLRRKHKTNINDIVSEVQKQLESSSSWFGYRPMHQKLRKNKFTVDRETG